MRPIFAVEPKIVGHWSYANPDGETPGIRFQLESDGQLHGELEKYRAFAIPSKTKSGTWVSRVVVRDDDPVARLDFHHMKPEGEEMTSEICDFLAGLLWSLYRGDKFRAPEGGK